MKGGDIMDFQKEGNLRKAVDLEKGGMTPITNYALQFTERSVMFQSEPQHPATLYSRGQTRVDINLQFTMFTTTNFAFSEKS